MLTVSVLGPISISIDGDTVDISGARMRAVFSVLVAHANEVVSTDRLLEEAWDGVPPRSGINALRVQINGLRSLLGSQSDALETASPGYVLRIDTDFIDATRHESTVTLAEQFKDANPERASQLLDEAETLWRGRPYEDVEGEFAETERRRLALVRDSARACRFEVELHLGRHQRVLTEIDDALAESPFEERLWRSKMIALYRDGRHAEALRAYRNLTESLADLGLDPSPESADVELQILNHDPRLSETRHRTSNVPVPSTSFVGERHLIDRVTDTIEATRCVSLLGTGGIGKTRVAIEAANEVARTYPGGTWFVDLTTLRDPDTVAIQCASQLGLYVPSGSSAIDTLQQWGSSAPRLLILDNCERVAEAAAALASHLIANCPDLSLVTTSRVRLGIAAETIVQMTPLRTQADGTVADGMSDAALLLHERAAQVMPDLDLNENAVELESISGLVEGMPLALELAAARLRHMTPRELLGELEHRFDILSDPSRSESPHRRALHATLEWSWQLLSPQAARACGALSLFRGGFTRDAALAIMPAGLNTDEVLAELIDSSLLKTHAQAGASRYRFLEAVRLFAISQIPRKDQPILRGRHAQYFADVADIGYIQMRSKSQAAVRASLAAETANLKAAILYASQIGDHDLETRIAAKAGNFWFETGQLDLGCRVLSKVASRQNVDRPPESLAKLYNTLAELNIWSGAINNAEDVLELEARRVDRSPATADALDLLGSRGLFAFIAGDFSGSVEHLAELIASDAVEPFQSAYARASMAYLLLRMGRRDQALAEIERALADGATLGEAAITAMAADFEGWLAFQDGHLAAAEWEWSVGERAYESLELFPMMADMRQLRAWAGIERGDADARALLASANQLMANYTLRQLIIRGNILMAAANARREPGAALEHLRNELTAALRSRSRTGCIWSLVYASRCATALGRESDAQVLAHSANTLRQRVPMAWPAWLTDDLLVAQHPHDASTDREVVERALESMM